ncbi:hypothetical protein [Streptomyces reniochalinae]|nr:hypothetical protein [Streptomyces reniochalinae]
MDGDTPGEPQRLRPLTRYERCSIIVQSLEAVALVALAAVAQFAR